MEKFSVKMRASEKDKHISGAEQILDATDLGEASVSLLTRALTHDKGNADFIQIKMEKKPVEEILFLKALPVTTRTTLSVEEGREEMLALLHQMGLKQPVSVLEMLPLTYHMRGAMLLDVTTMERLEPDKSRGIRATYMDRGTSEQKLKMEPPSDVEKKEGGHKGVKNHFQEALILATKVAHSPHILGEICISDDPHYVTGYIASKSLGYVRITTVKPMGSPHGGRIFLFSGEPHEKEETIRFLQEQWVLVEDVPLSPLSSCETMRETMGCTIDEDNREISGLNKVGEQGPFLKHDNKFLRYQQELDEWRELELIREEKVLFSSNISQKMSPSWVEYQNTPMLMMASNNYLGLTHHPDMIEIGKKALENYGTGTGGSRLTTGTTPLHQSLEKTLAKWKGTESAMVFNSGYVANFSILSALLRPEDVVFSDQLNHASLIDGCRYSGATIVIYAHNDMEDLTRKIEETLESGTLTGQGMIVSDGVFSMDGDIAPVDQLQQIGKKYGFLFFLDEAHSTGVLGETGRGLCEHFHLKEKPDLLMGTLSKALGAEGGFLCGNKIIIEYLRHKARGFMFSTALTPAAVACGEKAIELLEKDCSFVRKIQDNVCYFNQCCEKYKIPTHSYTPIFPIVVGEEQRAVEMAQQLQKEGFFISPIRYPTVAKGQARLRVVLMASHTKEELQRTAQAIAKVLREVN